MKKNLGLLALGLVLVASQDANAQFFRPRPIVPVVPVYPVNPYPVYPVPIVPVRPVYPVPVYPVRPVFPVPVYPTPIVPVYPIYPVFPVYPTPVFPVPYYGAQAQGAGFGAIRETSHSAGTLTVNAGQGSYSLRLNGDHADTVTLRLSDRCGVKIDSLIARDAQGAVTIGSLGQASEGGYSTATFSVRRNGQSARLESLTISAGANSQCSVEVLVGTN